MLWCVIIVVLVIRASRVDLIAIIVDGRYYYYCYDCCYSCRCNVVAGVVIVAMRVAPHSVVIVISDVVVMHVVVAIVVIVVIVIIISRVVVGVHSLRVVVRGGIVVVMSVLFCGWHCCL